MDIQSIEEISLRFDQVKVVAVTCLGVTSPLLANKKFDICIMDEAGQITLPVSILSGCAVINSISDGPGIEMIGQTYIVGCTS